MATIVGRYKAKPVHLPPGLIVKKRGGGLGYVTVRKPVPKPKPAAPTTPGVRTYSEYAAYPWAQSELVGLDRTEKAHEAYAGQVGGWLGQALTALTGVDPSHPGYNAQIQQQYLANVAGPVSAALNSAAAATPMTPSATTPGGIVAGANSFLGDAARTAAAEHQSAALQQAQTQEALNTIQPNTYAQSAIRAYADMQAGLPALYSQKREDLRSKIDQFITTAQETERHNRVTEATAALNAQTNAAIAFGKLGLDTQKLADTTAATTAAATTPAPYGYTRDPATGKVYRDPSIPSASSSGGGGGTSAPSAARGQYAPNALRKQGFVGGWKVRPKAKPAGIKGSLVQATDGSWWGKPATARTAAAAKPPRTSTQLQASLAGLWKAGGTGGIEERYSNDPKGAGVWLAQWVRDNKRDFTVPGSRKVNATKLQQVLDSIGGRPGAEAKSILVRGYINSQGAWK